MSNDNDGWGTVEVSEGNEESTQVAFEIEEEGGIKNWFKGSKKTAEPEPQVPTMPEQIDYAADLTEMILLGAMAQRTDTRIEYDADRMKVTNHRDFDRYVKEPVREGWDYGMELWK